VVFQRRVEAVKQVVQVVGDVTGCVPILIDRMITTGGTIRAALDALVAAGAKPEAYVCATHPVFIDGAVGALARPDIRELVVTNTIPIAPATHIPQMHVLSAAPLFAQAMRSIHRNESVSTLFT
jgi:ribose-phosphate pyrophosphokinase